MDFARRTPYYKDMKLLRRARKIDARTTVIIICTISLLAMFVCFWIGIHQSLWFDEAYSIMLAKQSPHEIIRLTAIDTHPPLYYLLLHYWGELFSWNVVALRSSSVLAYGGTIVIAGLLMRRLFGNRVAVVAVVLAALSPLMMRYGFELRMYALASLVGVLATFVLIAARTANGSRAIWLWIAYAVLVAIGVYSVYYLALLWIAHVVWLVWMSRRDLFSKSFWRLSWVWAYGLSIVLFSPWLPTMLKQVTNGALAPIGQAMNTENLFGVLSFNTIYQPLWQFDMLRSVLFLALLIALAILGIKSYKNSKSHERPSLLLLACYIGIPIVVLMVVSFARSMYVERYLAHVAIGLMMLIGVGIAIAWRRPSKAVYISTSVVVVACLCGILQLANVGNFNFQRVQRPTVDRVVKELDCRDDTAVVAADPYVMIEMMAYLPPSCNVHFYSDADQLRGGYAPLDQSPRQFESTNIPAFAPTMYYVYYDTPKLQVTNGYQSETRNFESLSLMTLRAS